MDCVDMVGHMYGVLLTLVRKFITAQTPCCPCCLSQIVETYKAPVEGWCEALIETTRLRSSTHTNDLGACLRDARPLPALVLTGLHDVIVPPARVDQLVQGLPLGRAAVLAGCGHLSHEEVPVTLLQHLQMYCSQVLV